MVADAARVAHAGGGDNHLGRLVRVEHLGLLQGLGHVEPREGEHVGAVPHQLQGLVVQVAPQVSGEDGGGLAGQGGVDIHREVLHGFHQMLLLDAAQEVEDLLGAAHGEGGDDDVAAPAQGAVNDLGQLGGVAPHLLVVPVAVGGLHDHVVRPGEQHRVPEDGLVEVADIAGEHDGLAHAVLRQVHGDAGGAQQVPGVAEGDRHPLAELEGDVVAPGVDKALDQLRVLDRVEGLHQGPARPQVLAVGILRVGLLDMGAVDEHNLHKPGGDPGGPDLAGEALAHQQGDAARVVNVGVGHQDVVDGVGGEGQLPVVGLVPALLEAAVDKDALAVYLQTVAAAGDALIRSKKAEFH